MLVKQVLRAAPILAVSFLIGLITSCEQSSNDLKGQTELSEQDHNDEHQFDEDSSESRVENFGVSIKDRSLYVHGEPLIIKGVAWNPVAKNQTHPNGLIFKDAGFYNEELIRKDIELMKEAGINVVRTYDVITKKEVLDLLSENGIYVIVPAFNYYGKSLKEVEDSILLLKDHPSTLLWEIGNEWNYNYFYNPNGNMASSIAKVQEIASLIRLLDRSHPISTAYGELPDKELVDELEQIDIWGLNVYSSISFGDRFERWSQISDKPIFLAEYGADAIDARLSPPAIDTDSQSLAIKNLTLEIKSSLGIRHEKHFLLGGVVFEWNDEWWKAGNPNQHDLGGEAPGGGPYPDQIFNEEWFGIVDIDRNPRPAYFELQRLYLEDDFTDLAELEP